jgi:hypothetical protein
MSLARTSKASRVPLRIWSVYLSVLGLLLLFFALIAQFAKTKFAQKFTAPQYFQTCEHKDQMPYLCISVADAETQVLRITQERKLAPEAAAQIHQLIVKLTVPASLQLAAGDHVNALQLNIALDKMR